MVTRTFHPLNTKPRLVETIEVNLAIQKRKVQINLLNKLKMLLLLQINFQTRNLGAQRQKFQSSANVSNARD